MIQKLKIAVVLLFCTWCVYFGLIRREHSCSARCSLWQHTRDQVMDDYRWIVHPDPYWTVFDPSQARISQDIEMEVLPNGASIHKAHWQEEDGDEYVVTYYRDRKDQCLMVSYGDWFETPCITPFDEWHYINAKGLVCFDWQKLVANLLFVIALFLVPAIVLVEVICHLDKKNDAENR